MENYTAGLLSNEQLLETLSPAPVLLNDTENEGGRLETASSDSIDLSAPSLAIDHQDNDDGALPATVEKQLKPEITLNLDGRYPLLPKPIVFLGVGDVNKKYAKYLDSFYEETFAIMNNAPTAGPSKARVMATMRLRAMIQLARLFDDHEGVKIRHPGVRFPKKIDIAAGITVFIEKNKQLLLALESFYFPPKMTVPTPVPEQNTEAVEQPQASEAA